MRALFSPGFPRTTCTRPSRDLNERDIEVRGRLAFLPLFAGSAAVTPEEQIYACGACSRARGVTEADLAQWGAKTCSPRQRSLPGGARSL
jgi:hypothetical protein